MNQGGTADKCLFVLDGGETLSRAFFCSFDRKRIFISILEGEKYDQGSNRKDREQGGFNL